MENEKTVFTEESDGTILCPECKKRARKNQIRKILCDSRKKVFDNGKFPVAAFGVLIIAALVSFAMQTADIFYRIFDVSEIIGIAAERNLENGRAYLEFAIIFLSVVPLVSGMYKYFMESDRNTGGSETESNPGVRCLFSIYGAGDSLFLMYANYIIKLLFPFIALKAYVYMSGKSGFIAEKTLELAIDVFDIPGLASDYAEIIVMLAASVYKLIFGILCICAATYILNAMFFTEYALLGGYSTSFFKNIAASIKLSRRYGKYIKSLNRKFAVWVFVSAVTLGAAAFYTVPYYFSAKAELSRLCINQEWCEAEKETVKNEFDNKLIPIPIDEKGENLI